LLGPYNHNSDITKQSNSQIRRVVEVLSRFNSDAFNLHLALRNLPVETTNEAVDIITVAKALQYTKGKCNNTYIIN
jgi:hypothetical protein